MQIKKGNYREHNSTSGPLPCDKMCRIRHEVTVAVVFQLYFLSTHTQTDTLASGNVYVYWHSHEYEKYFCVPPKHTLFRRDHPLILNQPDTLYIFPDLSLCSASQYISCVASYTPLINAPSLMVFLTTSFITLTILLFSLQPTFLESFLYFLILPISNL